MTRAIALLAALSVLSACATPSGSVPPAEQPKPKAVDVRICADVPKPPTLPKGADLVQPETAAERSAFALFVTWAAQLVDHDKQMTDRTELARRQSCSVP